MQSIDIQIEALDSHPDIVMIRIKGPLDTVAAYAFQEKMEELIASGVYKFIINLEQLDYISSAGIGVFPGVSQTLKNHQGDIVFTHVSAKTIKLFEMIGLTSLFTIRETTEKALKEFIPDEDE
ncbi:MAG: STAS domain-containing protein [bacterium]|nr:STAS domain-containing protein [bacterium]